MNITKLAELDTIIELTDQEKSWKEEGDYLPILISDNIAGKLDNPAIRRQFVPTVLEKCDELGNLDPLAEVEHTKAERLIHRYYNRAALLMTDRCFAYCRHCFRRRFTGTESGPITDEELFEASAYLKEHKEIKEVLLTGGDMFTLSDDRLDFILSTLKEARKDIIYRLCTRAIFSNPDRFTDNLFKVIEKNNYGAPFVLMTQFNHPAEIEDRQVEIVDRFMDLKIPAFNQSVLLRGVNDDVDVLEELSYKLMNARIKPYYLFQGDLVNGTGHLRCPLSRGLELEKELRMRVSGLAMPQYTIDLPEGGGKVPLGGGEFHRLDDGNWIFKSQYGKDRIYPEDK